MNKTYKKVFTGIFIGFVLLFVQTLHAQYREMLHKPYAEKYSSIGPLYSHIIGLKDSLNVKKKVDSIIAFASSNNDFELELEMELLWAYYLSGKKNYRNKGIIALEEVVNKAQQYKIEHIKIRGLREMANTYWNAFENYERAFEMYLKMEEALKNISTTQYPDKLLDLNTIAKAYYYFQDYNPAISILKQAVAIEENSFNSLHLADALNTLGLCYQKIENFKVSDSSFNAILKLKYPETVNTWGSIALGNLGYNHYLMGEFDLAKPLLIQDYENAVKNKDYGLAAGALIPLTEIELYNNNLSKAEVYSKMAFEFIQISKQTHRLRLLYPVLSKLYIKTNRVDQAMAFLDSAVLAQNNYHQKYSGLKLLRAEQKINLQQSNLKLAAFNLERQQKLEERNRLLFFISVLFIMVIALFMYYRHRQKARQQALQLMKTNLQQAQKNLEAAGKQLKRYVQSNIQKNNYIKQLEQFSQQEENRQVLNELKKTTILTDDDWNNFQDLFEKAHPGFIFQLRTRYQQLSQTEIRLLVLSKLLFTTKEMAAALGVSVNAIQVTRHRIRKKLGLDTDVKIESITDSL